MPAAAPRATDDGARQMFSLSRNAPITFFEIFFEIFDFLQKSTAPLQCTAHCHAVPLALAE
jgi:hypothetical protein